MRPIKRSPLETLLIKNSLTDLDGSTLVPFNICESTTFWIWNSFFAGLQKIPAWICRFLGSIHRKQ